MKRALVAALLLVLASAGTAMPPEAKKGERPAKEGKVVEKPEKPKELFSAETFKGLELTYGPTLRAGVRRGSTTVDEYRRPQDPNAWRFIPADSIQIQVGEESGSDGTHTTWSGNLKKDGIYLTISTTKSEAALLAIARALHPGRK